MLDVRVILTVLVAGEMTPHCLPIQILSGALERLRSVLLGAVLAGLDFNIEISPDHCSNTLKVQTKHDDQISNKIFLEFNAL